MSSLSCLACLVGLLGHPLSDRVFECTLRVDLLPQQIRVDYELAVTELTIARELLALLGPGQVPAEAGAQVERYQEILLPILARGVLLTIDGTEVPLEPVPGLAEHVLEDHVRYRFGLCAGRGRVPSNAELVLIDTNFDLERRSHLVCLRAGPGVRLVESSAPSSLEGVPRRPSWELTPEEEEASRMIRARFTLLETTPVDRARAVAPVGPATASHQAPTSPAPTRLDDPALVAPLARADSPNGVSHSGQKLRDLLSGGPDGWFGVILAGAFGLGLAHALKPGHGKTLVAAYLIGQQGTVLHAVVLGLVTALTHSGAVLVVALLLRPVAGSSWLDEGAVRFWLTAASGLTVLGVGASLLWSRLHVGEGGHGGHVHGPGGHQHLPDGTVRWLDHTGPPPEAPRWSSLFALGVSGGLLPCDDAVLLLLTAIGAGLMERAIFILLAFSGGLALALVVLGILVVKVRRLAAGAGAPAGGSSRDSGRIVRALHLASAGAITLAGLLLCGQAFTEWNRAW